MVRRSAGAGLAGLVLALAACGAPAVAPTPASSPSDAATPTTSPSVAPAVCETVTGGGSGFARITDMQLSSDGSDTLVVQFDAAVPAYELGSNSTGATFTGGGGLGGTFTLAGSVGVTLRLSHLLWTEPPGNQFPHGTDQTQPAGMVLEARQIENSEGIVLIAMGLAHPMCPTVSTLTNPARLVVHFAM